jgi:cytochrome c oxidase assembly factor CtaG
MRILLAALFLIGSASAASAHQLWGGFSSWTAALPVSLAAVLILFAWFSRRARLTLGEAISVGIGLAALALALIWPLPAWEDRSLTAHMVAHELLMVAAAPLLVGVRAWRFGIPAWPFATRRIGAAVLRSIRPSLSVLLQPLPATLISAAALWIWHLPGLFAAALTDPILHTAQHASFFFSALLFWAAMKTAARRQREATALICLFMTALHTGALGALMAFSPRSWYPLEGPPLLGLTLLEDQQLAGLIMWIPGGLVYAGAALLAFARMLARPARSTTRRIRA